MKYSKYPRIYENSKLRTGGNIILSGENLNYLKNVMRLKEGFKLRVFNENDGEYFAEITYNTKPESICLKEQYRKAENDNKRIILFAAIIKQDKFELICDMATQLGVHEIIPLITERVQKREINETRLNKIIIESVKQSERLSIPSLSQPINISEINNINFDHLYFANENEAVNDNHNFAKENIIAIIIGPEGGFTDEEISFLQKIENSISVSLGKNILRAETAAITLISRITV